MRAPNREIAQAAVRRLHEWASLAPQIPMTRGKPNRTAICLLLGIARSTVSSNPAIQAFFNELDQLSAIPVAKKKSPRNELAEELAWLEAENIRLIEACETMRREQDIALHLLATGRDIRD